MTGPVARAEVLEAALREIDAICDRGSYKRDSVKPPSVRAEIGTLARAIFDALDPEG